MRRLTLQRLSPYFYLFINFLKGLISKNKNILNFLIETNFNSEISPISVNEQMEKYRLDSLVVKGVISGYTLTKID